VAKDGEFFPAADPPHGLFVATSGVRWGKVTWIGVLSGPDKKVEYPLNRALENLIGRGIECHIQLNDPSASRLHAKFVFKEEGWQLIDSGSRNGTMVNGSKIDSALLVDGAKISIGDTEMLFTESGMHEVATVEITSIDSVIMLGEYSELAALESKEFGVQAFESLRSVGREKELSALHSFTLRCNALSTEQELVSVAMALLSEWTQADAVAFLLCNEYGGLDLAGRLAANPEYKPPISDHLTDLVTRQKRAVWVQHETPQSTKLPESELAKKPGFDDAICVPLIDKGNTIGALHLYRARGKFKRSDFDFAIAVASTLGVSLVRVLSAQVMQADLGRLQDKNAAFDELIGDSEGMTELKHRICRIARASGCILIRGESGAGKELVARAIHKNSQRASRPMLSVNCAAIPDELIESQLFGHVKGAFTGADRDHVGFFQQANKGTLFLDEVGELNLEGQAKLLRILEGHPFLPVGATKEVTVDVRVLSATNRDLREFVAEKRFREDLYYRISVFELQIPPLRQRGPDIDLLVEFFLNHFKNQNGRRNLRIIDEAMEVLRTYRWPGNVRQLRNVIDSAVVLADGNEILPRDLSLRDAHSLNEPSSATPPVAGTGSTLPPSASSKSPKVGANASSGPNNAQNADFDTLSVDVWEHRLIQEALRRTQGNIPAAAELMGISRATLYRKMEKGTPENPQVPPNPES